MDTEQLQHLFYSARDHRSASHQTEALFQSGVGVSPIHLQVRCTMDQVVKGC